MAPRTPRLPSPDLVGLRVRIYLNLHRPGHLSVVALEGPSKGKVVAHTLALALSDCRFVVSEAGRQRVLREQAKNVHAAIQGTITAIACAPEERPEFERRADTSSAMVARCTTTPTEPLSSSTETPRPDACRGAGRRTARLTPSAQRTQTVQA